MGFRAYLICVVSTIVTATICAGSNQRDFQTLERTGNALAVVGRIFVYSLQKEGENADAFEVFQKGQESLPQWLSFDAKKSSLVGVPSWRDRGELYLDIHSRGNMQQSLKIDIKDLRDGDLQVSSNSSNSKIISYSKPNCPKGLQVAAATILLDYHLGKLTGQQRVDILRKLSDFVDVDAEKLHMLAGKGHNTAFGFKDVVTVTAGPGNVADSKEPGVVISWQVGCGVDIPGARMASFLKSSAATGAFEQSLRLPVSEWHIAVGQPKEPRQRARRQAVQGKMAKANNHAARRNARAIQPTPTPSLTVAPPTSVIARVTITVTKTSSVAPTSTVAPTTTPTVPTTTEEPTTTAEPTTTDNATTKATTTTAKPTTADKPSTTERPTSSEQPTTKKETGTTTADKPSTTERPTFSEQSTTKKQPTTKETKTTEEPTATRRPNTTEEIATNVEITHSSVTPEEKTTELTTEGKQDPTIASTSVGPVTTKPDDNFPKLINPIDQISVYRGQGLLFHIPVDTFYDKEDTFTPNMSLAMKTSKWNSLTKSSWVNLDARRQIIYALPVDKSTVGIHKFIIIATDSDGGQAQDAITVNVLDDDKDSYNHQFELVLDYDFEEFSADLNISLSLLQKLAEYFRLNVSDIRVRDFVEGSVVLKFHLDTIGKEDCNSPLRRLFFDDEGQVSPRLKKALEPDFSVKNGSFQALGPCKDADVLGIVEASSGKWETYVIIPAVILVVVLLFIMGCLFLVVRSRRKRKMSLEDKNVFVFQKKPAVLQEEYEIKERLLKQPLVLPNEKPPLQPPTYPRSPSLKHANGDAPQTGGYQAPSFTSSRSPSIQASPGGSTRKPTYSGYRLPPAYVPP